MIALLGVMYAGCGHGEGDGGADGVERRMCIGGGSEQRDVRSYFLSLVPFFLFSLRSYQADSYQLFRFHADPTTHFIVGVRERERKKSKGKNN